MHASVHRDYRKACRRAEKAGWTMVKRKHGVLLRPPGGGEGVMLHRTPSDRRGLRNTFALLRAAGLKLEGK